MKQRDCLSLRKKKKKWLNGKHNPDFIRSVLDPIIDTPPENSLRVETETRSSFRS